MKTQSFCWMLALVLTFAGIASADPPAIQSPAPVTRMTVTRTGPGTASLHAGLFQDVCGDRARLIQVSFICILIGIGILWKK